MRKSNSRNRHSHDPILQTCFRAIVEGDRSQVSRLLKDFPDLPHLSLQSGATRNAAESHFFPEIAHYVYEGDTALHLAAAAYQLKMVQELIEMGANVSSRNRRGAEPLHYACDGAPGSNFWDPNAQSALIEHLISSGANPNAEDKSGVSPLHRAVRNRCAAAVQSLLTHGANALKKNKNGSTPLHLAVQTTGRSGSGSSESQTQQAKIVKLLLLHGAHSTDQDSSGRSVWDSTKSDWLLELLRS